MSPLEHYRKAEEMATAMVAAYDEGNAGEVLELAAMARTEFEAAAAGAALVGLHASQRVTDPAVIDQRYDRPTADTPSAD